MGKGEMSDLDRVVTEIYFDDLSKQVGSFIALNSYSLNLSSAYSDVEDARLSCIDVICSQNVNIFGGSVSFDVVVKCDIDVDTVERGYELHKKSSTVNRWLKAHCEFAGREKIESFSVRRVELYSKDRESSNATQSLVPVMRKDDFDEEASTFLKNYCPEVLGIPMAVPVEEIAKKCMGLEVLKHRLSEDLSIFGQMCFSVGKAEIYDKNEEEFREIEVKPGTMIIDPDTFYLRTVGCLNNTIAHECTHWEHHKYYHFVRDMLDGNNKMACRCPVDEKDEKKNQSWSDEDWMEWQANGIAPRILMPRETFIRKANELLQIRKKHCSPDNPRLIKWIIGDISDFYKVSKQSAEIRLKELGLWGNLRL
jgi:hypothetical protein